MILVLNGADFSQSNIGHVELPVVLEPETTAFLTKVQNADPTFDVNRYERPLNNLITSLKDNYLFGKFFLLNLYLGLTKESQLIPLIDVDNVGNVFYEGNYPVTFDINGWLKSNPSDISGKVYSDYSYIGFFVPPSLSEQRANGATVFVGQVDANALGCGDLNVPVPSVCPFANRGGDRYGHFNTLNHIYGVTCSSDSVSTSIYFTVNNGTKTFGYKEGVLGEPETGGDEIIPDFGTNTYVNISGFLNPTAFIDNHTLRYPSNEISA